MVNFLNLWSWLFFFRYLVGCSFHEKRWDTLKIFRIIKCYIFGSSCTHNCSFGLQLRKTTVYFSDGICLVLIRNSLLALLLTDTWRNIFLYLTFVMVSVFLPESYNLLHRLSGRAAWTWWEGRLLDKRSWLTWIYQSRVKIAVDNLSACELILLDIR